MLRQGLKGKDRNQFGVCLCFFDFFEINIQMTRSHGTQKINTKIMHWIIFLKPQ